MPTHGPTLSAVLLAALALATPAIAGQSGIWAVEGVLADACQCNVHCACEFDEKPTFGHCDDAAILNVEKGHWGEVPLDGLQVLVVSQSPHGERLVDTVGRLTFAHIYVPEGSTDEQARALAEIARRTWGSFNDGVARLSANETVEKVPMSITTEPYRYAATIPGILELDIEVILGGDGKTPLKLGNNPFSGYGFEDPFIARSKSYTYKRGDIDWNYAGRAASIRAFKLGGEIGVAEATAPAAPAAHEHRGDHTHHGRH